ncbi:MAG TPA: MtrAB system histidine kinase MtrB [Mycobacteriales bacterium]|nr:MtrAB system histidine kinase MtrB [Mycobacteriales bacterium]
MRVPDIVGRLIRIPRLPGPRVALRLLTIPALRRRWRRSLSFRIVSTTLLVSVVVVAVLGVVLLDQVGRGLLDAKRKASLAEVAADVAVAQSQLNQTPAATPAELDPLLESLVNQLSIRGNGVYSVALLSTSDVGTGFDSGGVRQALPQRLRDVVVRQQAEASTYVHLDSAPPSAPGVAGGGPTEALVVGAPLAARTTSATYELYLLFPLRAEEQTLGLVRRTLALGGAALVGLLALISFLVTRQVVRPVRQAAQVATRLAAGRLQERMAVHGQDDLARLATSFNEMARGLQRQISELEELSRVQRRFTADVSHELRTPLTTVRMAADLLHEARADFTAEVARSSELLVGELDRFEALLGDLLEISRYDARAAVLEVEPTDVAGLLRSECAYATRLAGDRGSILSTSGIPEEPVLAEVDGRRVSRIVRNLLSNAVEHGEGAQIEISLAADEESVALRVRDHGVGLRPGEAGLVFGRFWRADPSRARRTGGTGLGLSIALEDARLHGGWLQAWGEPGRGACFRLVLPRVAGGPLHGSPLPLQPADAETPADDAGHQPTPPGSAATVPPPGRGVVEAGR